MGALGSAMQAGLLAGVGCGCPSVSGRSSSQSVRALLPIAVSATSPLFGCGDHSAGVRGVGKAGSSLACQGDSYMPQVAQV